MLPPQIWSSANFRQAVNVIWHKAASPPHMDGSPGCATVQPIVYIYTQIGMWTLPVLPPAESFWVYRPPNMSGYVLGRSLPLQVFTCGDLDHVFSRPPESKSQTASRSVQPFLHGSWSWQTDRPRYSVYSNWPHLHSTAMLPDDWMTSFTADTCVLKLFHRFTCGL